MLKKFFRFFEEKFFESFLRVFFWGNSLRYKTRRFTHRITIKELLIITIRAFL